MNQKPQLSSAERLKNGAVFLGKLWKTPDQRCPSGWSLNECECVPLKKFCVARNLWLVLGIETCRDLEEGPFGLATAMTASEWDSTGLAMKIDHPKVGVINIGSAPSCVTGMVDMGKMMDAPEVLESTLRVLKAFPKSRVEGLSDQIEAPIVVDIVAEVEVEVEANPDEAFE